MAQVILGEEWHGAGWYKIGWSDGGEEEPTYYDSIIDFVDDVKFYDSISTEYHLAYFEYMGDELPDYSEVD